MARQPYGQAQVRASLAAERQRRVISRQAAQAIQQAAADQIREGLTKAYVAAIQQAATIAKEVAKVAQAGESAYRKNMFRSLGELAQKSMLASYDQLVTSQEGPASRTHYRAGQDRLPKTLRKALANSAFFTASADGLSFGDTQYLDSEAAHWHRINFGASPAGQGGDAEYPVRFGTSATSIGFEEGASPGFAMPAGIWLNTAGGLVRGGKNPRGADLFFPSKLTDNTAAGNLMGTTRRTAIRSRPNGLRPSHGIEAKNFMNAGIRRLADEIPYAFDQYTKDLVEGAIDKVSSTRRRAEIIQGPTRTTSSPRHGLTYGVEGNTGFRMDLG